MGPRWCWEYFFLQRPSCARTAWSAPWWPVLWAQSGDLREPLCLLGTIIIQIADRCMRGLVRVHGYPRALQAISLVGPPALCPLRCPLSLLSSSIPRISFSPLLPPTLYEISITERRARKAKEKEKASCCVGPVVSSLLLRPSVSRGDRPIGAARLTPTFFFARPPGRAQISPPHTSAPFSSFLQLSFQLRI